jgi:hypothetical protein
VLRQRDALVAALYTDPPPRQVLVALDHDTARASFGYPKK